MKKADKEYIGNKDQLVLISLFSLFSDKKAMGKTRKSKAKQSKPLYSAFQNWPDQSYLKNRDLLVQSSVKTKKFRQLPLVVAGSSHVKKWGFQKELKGQFWKGLQNRQRLGVFPGPILGIPGGKLDSGDRFIELAKDVASRPGYEGQIFVLVLGTNDASESPDPIEYSQRYEKLCQTLLSVPQLVLLPASLLPRKPNTRYPHRNANMYTLSNVIRNVVRNLNKTKEFEKRISYVNVHLNIAKVIVKPKQENQLIPFVGMLQKDNVHLTPKANALFAANVLKGVSFVDVANFQK